MTVRALRRRGDSVNPANATVPLMLAVPLVPLAAVACVAVCAALLVGGPVSVLWCVAWSRLNRSSNAADHEVERDEPTLKLAVATTPESFRRDEREMTLATAA